MTVNKDQLSRKSSFGNARPTELVESAQEPLLFCNAQNTEALCSPNQDSPGSTGALLARGKQMRPITPYNSRVTTTGVPVAHELIGPIGALFMAPKIFGWGA
jgi:hypothetical protein